MIIRAIILSALLNPLCTVVCVRAIIASKVPLKVDLGDLTLATSMMLYVVVFIIMLMTAMMMDLVALTIDPAGTLQ